MKMPKIPIKSVMAKWSAVQVIAAIFVVGWLSKGFVRTVIKEAIHEDIQVIQNDVKTLKINDSLQSISQVRTNIILKGFKESNDSTLLLTKKSFALSVANYKANIDIGKQLKDFDILKFYEQFMLYNMVDSVKKKRMSSQIAYE